MTLSDEFKHRDLVSKGVRRVRTPAGVKYFKAPIGTPIGPGMGGHPRPPKKKLGEGTLNRNIGSVKSLDEIMERGRAASSGKSAMRRVRDTRKPSYRTGGKKPDG